MDKSFQSELERSRKLIFGVKENPVISSRIIGLYPAEKISFGIDLYNQTKAAEAKQQAESSQSESANDKYKNVKLELRDGYIYLRRALRYFYKDDPGMCSELQCNGTIPSDFANWKSWVAKTLTYTLSSDEVIGKLAKFKITEDQLKKMQSGLKELEQLSIDAEREDGEAQQATVVKDQLYDDLLAYCADLRECLMIAFYDKSERQKLEEVGIIVK